MMTITHAQCRVLASSGSRTNLAFSFCKFWELNAFLDRYAERQDEASGPAALRLWGLHSHDQETLVCILGLNRLESLTLDLITLTAELGRAVAIAQVRRLKLKQCKFFDRGVALIESVRLGRGPIELHLVSSDECIDREERFPFDSPGRFVSFLDTLRGNTYLEKLDLSCIHVRHGIPQALASALKENKGMVHLGLCNCVEDEKCWSELMDDISTHPKLLSLNIQRVAYTLEES
jgi:hypothetical protein